MLKRINIDDILGCPCMLPDKCETELSSGAYIGLYLGRDDKDFNYALYAVADDNTDYARISFCPFCGRKLSGKK